MTSNRTLAWTSTVLTLLGCGIETEGAASPDAGTGAAGSGGSLIGGSGGASGAGAAGAAGAPPTTCAQGLQCVPQAPAGWGHAFLSVEPYSTAAGPTCPDGAGPQPFFAEPAPATCLPCACGALQGGACTVPLVCGYNSTCSSFQDFTRHDGGCSYESGSPTLSCMLGGGTVTAAGTCTPSGGTPAPGPEWKQSAHLCPAKTSSACGPASVCVPAGTGTYATSICIYLPGEQQCPGDWPDRTFIYQKAIDKRTCSPCTCVQGAVSCVAEYEFFDDGACLWDSKKVATTACTDVTSTINGVWPLWSYRRSKAPTLVGGCIPGGGIPGGQFVGDPNTALTVCCRKAG